MNHNWKELYFLVNDFTMNQKDFHQVTKTHTFCAASCSSLWAITLCLDALELNLPPELTGGEGLDSAVDVSFSLPRFFLSGMRSGALASKATPERKKPFDFYTLLKSHSILRENKSAMWFVNLTYVGMFESSNIICTIPTHQCHITQPLKTGDNKFLKHNRQYHSINLLYLK